MDALSDTLRSLHVTGAALGRFELRAPWALDIAGFEPGYAYSVIKGAVLLLRDKEPPVQLIAGESVIMLRGGRCRLASDADVPAVSIGAVWEGQGLPVFGPGIGLERPVTLRWGGEDASAELLALAFDFNHQHPLVEGLPECVVLRKSGSGAVPLLHATLEFLATEHLESNPGYGAVAAHLVSALFTSLVRSYALHDAELSPGVLRGLADRRLGLALKAVHAHPETKWTVASMAERAGMSRSAFAQHFAAVVGVTPMDYLVSWRVHCACRLLAAGKSVAWTAEAVGYDGERAFRKVFKAATGVTPSAFKRGDARSTQIGRHVP